MAKSDGTIICCGLLLIFLNIMSGTPGGIAGVVIFWIIYFICVSIKRGSSSGSSGSRMSSQLEGLITNCPNCRAELIFNENEYKRCEHCGFDLEKNKDEINTNLPGK